MTFDTASIWLAVICTFAIFSFLIRENPIYRLFEHIFIGVGVGLGVYYTIIITIIPRWWDPMFGRNNPTGEWNLLWLLPFLFGCLIYFIYSKKYGWIARALMGFYMGLGAGGFFRMVFAEQTPQIVATFRNFDPVQLAALGTGPIWWKITENVLFIGMFLCVMMYFFFSFRHDVPVIKQTSAAGRWVLMISFGALFGSTVMGRMSLLIQRLQFLFQDWLGFSL